jgi:phosphoglycerate dehydrogenase-like enzyme
MDRVSWQRYHFADQLPSRRLRTVVGTRAALQDHRMTLVVIPDDRSGSFAQSANTRRLEAVAEVVIHDSVPAGPEDLASRVRDADVIVSFRPAFTKFPAVVLRACERLRMICISGTGVEDVDVAEASKRGIAVANVAGASNQAVAEMCIALMFDVARHVSRAHGVIRGGKWQGFEGIELQGKTLGILGLSAIARHLVPLAAGIGMRVLSWSHNNDPARAKAAGAMAAPLADVLRESDVLSLHMRLFPELAGFLGEKEFAQMKPGAILINTARGELVDEAALIAALASGRLRGAGLDVFARQPLPEQHPLRDLPNVVLSPFNAWNTTDASERMLRQSVDNILNFLSGQPTNVVNPAR